MATMNAKRWVMAVLAAGGLALGTGGVWTANAQDKPKEPPADEKKLAMEKLKKAEADEKKWALEELKKKVEADESKLREYENTYKKAIEEAKKQLGDAQKKWAEADYSDLNKLFERVQKDGDAKSPEFLYLGQKAGFAPTAGEFEEAVKGVEAKGYTFVGVVTMKGQTKGKDGEAVPTLVFRRSSGLSFDKVTGKLFDKVTEKRAEKAPAEKAPGKQPENVPGTKQPEKLPPTAADDLRKALPGKEKLLQSVKESAEEKKLQAEIDRLAKELAELKKGEAKPAAAQVKLPLAQLGGNGESASQFITQLVRLKYGEKAAGGLSFDTAKDTLLVNGLSKEQVAWLTETVNGIAGQKPPTK